MTWPSDPTAVCPLSAGGSVMTFDSACAGYRVINTVPPKGNGGWTLYYDAKTSKLVAVVEYSNFDRSCQGGPTDFAEPACNIQPDAGGHQTSCGGAGDASAGGASAGGASTGGAPMGGAPAGGGAAGTAP